MAHLKRTEMNEEASRTRLTILIIYLESMKVKHIVDDDDWLWFIIKVEI